MSDRKLTKLAEISGIVSALIAIISLLFIYFPKNEKFEKTNTIKSEEKDSVLNVKNTETQKNEISNKNVLDIENATCTILETPTFDGVFSANNLGSTISLRQSEKNKNQITDDAKWYADNHLELPLYKIPTIFSEKTNLPENIPLKYKDYRITRGFNYDNYQIFFYGENFSESRFLIITDKEMSKIIKFYDFIYYTKSPKTKPGDESFVYQQLDWAIIENDILYVSNSHSTYAESSANKNAYITAINLKDNSIIWRSEPLTSNCNFTIIKDNIVCGYGFTAEPDFIYIINKYSGRRLEKIKLNSGPSCILEKNETLYVRTYDTDYKFNIMK